MFAFDHSIALIGDRLPNLPTKYPTLRAETIGNKKTTEDPVQLSIEVCIKMLQ